MTHFCLSDSRPDRRATNMRDTPCGLRVPIAEHSNSPSCSACATYARERAEDTRTAEDVFGAPEPAPVRRRRPEPDPVEEYEADYNRRFGVKRG